MSKLTLKPAQSLDWTDFGQVYSTGFLSQNVFGRLYVNYSSVD